MTVSARSTGDWTAEREVASATSTRPLVRIDEDVLVDAAIAGDADAFAVLYDHYMERVYRHCYYRTGNRTESEDLTQQTFLHAWQAIGRYRRGATPFIAWLLTISQRLVISHYRRARPTVDLDSTVIQAAPTSDPETVVERSLACDTVRAAVLRLKADRQNVIILRYIEGFSVAEVAAALGKSENNIRVLQHRALADLRRELEQPELAPAAADPTLLERIRARAARLVISHRD